MSQSFHSRRTTFALVACAALLAATALPLTSASCGATQQPRPRTSRSLRAPARADARRAAAAPSRIVAQIAARARRARARARSRVSLRARLTLEARDFAGAASLLDAKTSRDHTRRRRPRPLDARRRAWSKPGRRVEARAAFEQLARDFPDSLRARDATLRAAQLRAAGRTAAAVPVALKKLADADDADALLLTAKAYEQSGDQQRALAAYRRLYFYAPASATNDAEAVGRLRAS